MNKYYQIFRRRFYLVFKKSIFLNLLRTEKANVIIAAVVRLLFLVQNIIVGTLFIKQSYV